MPEGPPVRRDGSMQLLVDTMTQTLDRGYADAAGRRASSPSGSPSGRWTLPLLLLLGLLTGTAAAHVRGRSQELDQTRAALVGEAQRRTQETDELVGEVERLRAQVRSLQSEALGAGAQGRAAAQRLAELELAAAVVPVEGPGVVLRLDDAPDDGDQEVDARGGNAGQGRVLDRDLQDAVNGLWAAGAEAVSVNDLRLSALTAIRSAGEAVLVDFRPLSPPYDVRAVGDPEGLDQRFSQGLTGRRLAEYPERYGIGVDLRRADALRLPAASLPDLRAAR